jgi:hypothetical protein
MANSRPCAHIRHHSIYVVDCIVLKFLLSYPWPQKWASNPQPNALEAFALPIELFWVVISTAKSYCDDPKAIKRPHIPFHVCGIYGFMFNFKVIFSQLHYFLTSVISAKSQSTLLQAWYTLLPSIVRIKTVWLHFGHFVSDS